MQSYNFFQNYSYLCENNYSKNMTILYPSPIFGPVKSRRLGVSLGINLQPADGKACTFDCIYCECGLNADHRPHSHRPKREEVTKALEEKLIQMTEEGLLPDVLTFAGNGEPTGHPDFLGIIQDTIALRDRYCPNAKVSVLSNATCCGIESVREALMLVDNNILKLDTVNADYIKLIDRPTNPVYDVNFIIKSMMAFKGHCIIQTMFMKGKAQLENGTVVDVDNTGEEYVAPWLDAVKKIAPSQVMIYTIDRETPVKGLQKATPEELDAICDRVKALGIACTASY